MKALFLKNRHVFLVIVTIGVLIGSILFFVNVYFRNKIFPQVKIAGVTVSRLNKDEAKIVLSQNISTPKSIDITLKDKTFHINLDEVDFAYDINGAVDRAYLLYRSGRVVDNVIRRIFSPITFSNISLPANINKDKLIELIENEASGMLTAPTYPQISFLKGKIEINKGSGGERINLQELTKEIEMRFSGGDFSKIRVPVEQIDPSISSDEAGALEVRGKALVGKKISLTYDYESYVLKDSDTIPLLLVNNSYNGEAVQDIVDEDITPFYNREPQNAVFKEEGGRAVEFLPAKDGVEVNDGELKDKILQSLTSLENTNDKQIILDVPVITTPAKITTGEVNSLGITSLIGRGSSKFTGSIPSRIHNVVLASSRFNGILVAPEICFHLMIPWAMFLHIRATSKPI